MIEDYTALKTPAIPNAARLPQTAIDQITGIAARHERVPNAPVFSYKNDVERRRATDLLELPSKYSRVTDAYRALSQTPGFRSEKISPEGGGRERHTNPIATGYMLKTIGSGSFRAIVGQFQPDEKKHLLDAILKGDNDVMLQTLLSDPPFDTDFDDTLLMPRSDTKHREVGAQHLLELLCSDRSDEKKLELASFALSSKIKKDLRDVTLQDAQRWIAETFQLKAAQWATWRERAQLDRGLERRGR